MKYRRKWDILHEVTRFVPIFALVPALVACVPEWKPDAGTAPDAEDGAECMPHSPGLETWDPAAGTETGYDHRGGLSSSGDSGVIYHDAYLERDETLGNHTMLSFQDFYGEEVDGVPFIRTDRVHDIEINDYLDCKICVLYLEDCPRESMGGCGRQFLAVEGTIRYLDFEKDDGSWREDTLGRLSVEMTGLRFREVRIDPITYETRIPDHVCPDELCYSESEDDDCFGIASYTFSYVSD